KHRPLQSPPVRRISASRIGTARRINFDVTMAPVTRFATLLFLAASPLFAQAQQDGLADPVFSRIPFDQWLSQGDQPHMRWTVRLSDPELSTHQRLITEVHVEV